MARCGSSDLLVFHQIFTLREYRALDQLNLNDGLMVDLGANVGYASTYFLSRFAALKVVAIEPDRANFELLNKNLQPYGSRITTIQAAIWPGVDRVALHDPGKGEEWGIKVYPHASGSIPTITIPEIMHKAGVHRISLLKIDIEGAEEQLFKGDTSWLNRVDNLVAELHGDDCERAFFSKINPQEFIISKCDELTVCIRPKIA